MNVYALKMAAVFMISTATLGYPHAHPAALDRAARLCSGAAAAGEQPFC
jgi:hypothetical protein